MGASRTNRDRLDLDTVFNMSIGGIIRILMLEDVLAAERVDEGGSACGASQLLGRSEALGNAIDEGSASIL